MDNRGVIRKWLEDVWQRLIVSREQAIATLRIDPQHIFNQINGIYG
jgi:hypothetical protein